MQASLIQKYNKKSLSQLKQKATFEFNKFIRERDARNDFFHCISCKRQGSAKQMHAGHFYSGGHYPELKFDENNVHGQCVQCNFFLSGNLISYRLNLIAKIGVEAVEELDLTVSKYKHSVFKWNRFFLIEIIEKYKEINKKNSQQIKQQADGR